MNRPPRFPMGVPRLGAPHMGVPIHASVIGTDTKSGDPRARVFVGNLNTGKASREDVQKVFQRYGPIMAISMHKGFAFVQFHSVPVARTAAQDVNGRVLVGQILDCNIACEPKANQQAPKLESAQAGEPNPFKKRKGENGAPIPQLLESSVYQTSGAAGEGYYGYDIIICGNCKEQFTDVYSLNEHKQMGCQLVYNCRCAALQQKAANEPAVLTCATCQQTYQNSWDLLSHAQVDHQVLLYIAPTAPTAVPSVAVPGTPVSMVTS